jgi:hypothetical protein
LKQATLCTAASLSNLNKGGLFLPLDAASRHDSRISSTPTCEENQVRIIIRQEKDYNLTICPSGFLQKKADTGHRVKEVPALSSRTCFTEPG